MDLTTLLRAADPGGSGSTIGCYEFLHHLATVAPKGTFRLLDIGTHTGLSAAVLAYADPLCRVETIDWTGGLEMRAAREANWRAFGVLDRVRSHLGDSRDVAPLLDSDYDLAFIDGGHADDVVAADYRNLRDRCPILAFHDAYGNVSILRDAVADRPWIVVETRPGTLAPEADWRDCRAALERAYPEEREEKTGHMRRGAWVWRAGDRVHFADPGFVVLIRPEGKPWSVRE